MTALPIQETHVVPKWSKMTQNGQKWSKMTQKDTKTLKNTVVISVLKSTKFAPEFNPKSDNQKVNQIR